MKLTHHDLSADLDDEWWSEAGMVGFIPASNAYRSDPTLSWDGQPILEVRISDVGPVGPVRRAIGIFVENEDGKTARERVLDILQGFRSGDSLPPVEIKDAQLGSPHRYELKHGCHRFYCAVAAGFARIPAIMRHY